jgi:hypothetical protein
MAKIGRKSKYDEDTFPLLAEKYARDGLSDTQIAKNLRISKTVFYQYQLDFPKFKEAIKEGKKPIDIMVENMYLKRCLGYEYTETHTELTVDAKGNAKPGKVRKTKKTALPDMRGMENWLKMRDPERWNNKDGPLPKPDDDLEEMTKEERDAEIEKLLKKRGKGA